VHPVAETRIAAGCCCHHVAAGSTQGGFDGHAGMEVRMRGLHVPHVHTFFGPVLLVLISGIALRLAGLASASVKRMPMKSLAKVSFALHFMLMLACS